MLSQSTVDQFVKDGFVNGGPVLSDAQVDVLRDELTRVLENKEGPGPKPVGISNLTNDPNRAVWQIVNIWQASEPYKDLVFNKAIVEAAAQLLPDTKELRVWHDQIQYKPKGTGGVNMWHQDSPYWATLEPKHQQMTAWIALDDVDESNGCMSMVPGSYRWGNQIEFLHTIKDYNAMPKEFQGHPITTRFCPVKKGHVHFHHSLTWHGSHANTSGRPRRAIALHYMNDKTVFNAAGGHCMQQFVRSKDKEMVVGDAFPVVWKQA